MPPQKAKQKEGWQVLEVRVCVFVVCAVAHGHLCLLGSCNMNVKRKQRGGFQERSERFQTGYSARITSYLGYGIFLRPLRGLLQLTANAGDSAVAQWILSETKTRLLSGKDFFVEQQ